MSGLYTAEVYGESGLLCTLPLEKCDTAEGFVLTLPREKLPADTRRIDFAPALFASPVDENGWYILTDGGGGVGTMLCELHEREDTEFENRAPLIPVIGASTKNGCYVAIATGMDWDLWPVAGVKSGRYYLFFRFTVRPEMVYEDLQVTVIRLPDGSSYSDMARVYRNRKLSEGVKTLKEKAAARPAVEKALLGPEVRIRNAWKPVPSPVDHQTPENEPPVQVACTFEKAEHLLHTLKEKGVEDAHICLVGWNIGGHDGRWMQHFPVEEKLGGEEALKKLIATAKELGYQIVGHSNVNDSYTIAEMWDEGDMIIRADGTVSSTDFRWGGGKPYQVCPTKYEKTVERDYPRMAALGFEGIHYVDVLSILRPDICYSKEHFCNTKTSIECIRKVMTRSRELFGGFASEGAMDYAVEDLDFALYCGMNLMGETPAICDRRIPFWQLVYHGIVMYNPSSETVNYPVKSKANQLRFLEYGGRPAAYIHSKFLSSGNHWMGVDDITCATEEELQAACDAIAQMYREYMPLQHLQYEFMEKHEKVGENVFETTYSDGTVIRVDYDKETYEVISEKKEAAENAHK